jgi:hypothetical protein
MRYARPTAVVFVFLAAVPAHAGPDCPAFRNDGVQCTTPDIIGTIPWGSATDVSGGLPANGSGDHWYVAFFAPGKAGLKPTILLTAGAGEYVFDVYDSCDERNVCFNPGSTESSGTRYWTGNDPSNPAVGSSCVQPFHALLIRVRQVNPNPHCSGYMLLVQNG